MARRKSTREEVGEAAIEIGETTRPTFGGG